MENCKTEITLLWQKRLNWNYHEEVLSLDPLTCHCFIFSGKLNMKPLLGDKKHHLPADILSLCQGGKALQISVLRPGFPVKISLETSELFSGPGPAHAQVQLQRFVVWGHCSALKILESSAGAWEGENLFWCIPSYIFLLARLSADPVSHLSRDGQ